MLLLVRVLSVKWIWFELGYGVVFVQCLCVCTFGGCTFLPGCSVTVWVRSGCGVCVQVYAAGVRGRCSVYMYAVCVCLCAREALWCSMLVWCVFTP